MQSFFKKIVFLTTLLGAANLFGQATSKTLDPIVAGSGSDPTLVSLAPTSFVEGISYQLNTNSGLLFITNDASASPYFAPSSIENARAANAFSFVTNVTLGTPVSGTTTETNLAVINIPANVIGSNGLVFVSGTLERRTGSPGGVSFRARWGSGTPITAQLIESLPAGASNASISIAKEIHAANSLTNLVCVGTTVSIGNASANPPVFLTNSTLNAIPVYFNALPNITTETNILWGAHIHVINQK